MGGTKGNKKGSGLERNKLDFLLNREHEKSSNAKKETWEWESEHMPKEEYKTYYLSLKIWRKGKVQLELKLERETSVG